MKTILIYNNIPLNNNNNIKLCSYIYQSQKGSQREEVNDLEKIIIRKKKIKFRKQ